MTHLQFDNCDLRFNLPNLAIIMLLVLLMDIILTTKAYLFIGSVIWCLTCSSDCIYSTFNCINTIDANIRGTSNALVDRNDISLTAINSASFACYAVGLSIGLSHLVLKTVELAPFIAIAAIISIIFDVFDPISAILCDLTCFTFDFNDNTNWFEFMCVIVVILMVLMQNEIKLLITSLVFDISSILDNNSATEMINTAWITSLNDKTDNLCHKIKYTCARMQQLFAMGVCTLGTNCSNAENDYTMMYKFSSSIIAY